MPFTGPQFPVKGFRHFLDHLQYKHDQICDNKHEYRIQQRADDLNRKVVRVAGVIGIKTVSYTYCRKFSEYSAMNQVYPKSLIAQM